MAPTRLPVSLRVILFLGLARTSYTHLTPREPRQTDYPDNEPRNDGPSTPLGWTPKPTSGPEYAADFAGMHALDILKRQAAAVPNGTCGYVSGDINDPVTCISANQYCGYNSIFSAVGCCSSYYPVGTAYSLTGCNFYTTCFDSTQGCGAGCSDNYRAIYCASSGFPYCAKGYWTDINSAVLSCAPSRTTQLVGLTPGQGFVGVSTTPVVSSTPTPAASVPASTVISSPVVTPTTTPMASSVSSPVVTPDENSSSSIFTPVTPSTPGTPATPSGGGVFGPDQASAGPGGNGAGAGVVATMTSVTSSAMAAAGTRAPRAIGLGLAVLAAVMVVE